MTIRLLPCCAGYKSLYCFRKILLLENVDFGLNCFGCVFRRYGSLELGNDFAAVTDIAYIVYGYARFLFSGGFHCLMHMVAVHTLAAEFRKQGRVDVDNFAIVFFRYEFGYHEHEAGQDDKVYFETFK